MNVRINSSPRPLAFSMLAGSSGSGSRDGSKPGPSSRTTYTDSSGVSRAETCTRRLRYGSWCRRWSPSRWYSAQLLSRRAELSSRLPWSIAFRTASRRATDTRNSVVSSAVLMTDRLSFR